MRDFNAELRDLDVFANLDHTLERFLQTRFNSPRSSQELPVTLTRLREFVLSVNTDGFGNAVGKILGPGMLPLTATELVRDLSDNFCQEFTGPESDLLRKSLQEAFLFSAAMDGSASVPQFGITFGEFLRRRGVRGLMRLVLGLHMFNTLWFELLESDAIPVRTEEALNRLSTVLEHACFDKAEAAIQMIALHDVKPEDWFSAGQ